jgi:hypothetical protein
MRRVAQLDENGCGVACVAILAGITYSQARRQMFGREAGSFTETGDPRNALRKRGIPVGNRLVPLRTRNYMDLRHHAILKVNVHPNWWLWVVWDAGRRKPIDPRRPPYRRIRAVSFLKVQLPTRN